MLCACARVYNWMYVYTCGLHTLSCWHILLYVSIIMLKRRGSPYKKVYTVKVYCHAAPPHICAHPCLLEESTQETRSFIVCVQETQVAKHEDWDGEDWWTCLDVCLSVCHCISVCLPESVRLSVYLSVSVLMSSYLEYCSSLDCRYSLWRESLSNSRNIRQRVRGVDVQQ